MRLLAVAALWFGFTASAQPVPLPCGEKDSACAREAARTHPVRKPEFWRAALAKPVGERIGPAPPELVHFVTLDNVANGYPNRPRVSKLTPDFLADVKRAFEAIPAAVKRRLEAKLAGIYFADDFGGTGFSDEIGEAGKAKLGFVLLDPTVLTARKANDWATWKENSPFKPAKGLALEATIEKPGDDTRANAIQYILLHELGHVLSVGEDALPSWALEPKNVKSTREFPFFELSWTIAGDRYASLFDARFPQRKDVVFYFGAKLDATAMVDTYAALEATNFPTLYAATHPGDDFAESLVNYVHVEMMGKPFEIRIRNGSKVVKRYGACWREPRCAAKRAYLEKFLATGK
jgi:hypothetical protein